MQCKSLDSRIYAELASLNAGLLRVLVWQDPAQRAAHLGLEPSVSSQLLKLTRDELDFIASTPVLLAGFAAPRPGGGGVRIADAATSGDPYGPIFGALLPPDSCDSPVGEHHTDPWSRMARLFTAALLTWLWKMDRCDQLVTALCIGPGTQLPPLSIPVIEEFAGQATRHLRVRFGEHPRIWPDLIRAARSHDPDLRLRSRLAVLPVVLAEEQFD